MLMDVTMMQPIYCFACGTQMQPQMPACPRCAAPAASFPDSVRRLVDRFSASENKQASAPHKSTTRVGTDSIEAQLRHDFLDPLFEALGWDMHNQRSDPREVVVEFDLYEGSREKVDYCFRVNRVPQFFVEAKAAWENLDNHFWQIFGYSEIGQMPLVILTNFKELRVYARCAAASRKKSDPNGFLKIGQITCNAYERHWARLYALFSQPAVQRGTISAILQRVEQSGGNFNLFSDVPQALHVPQIASHQGASSPAQEPYSSAGHAQPPQSFQVTPATGAAGPADGRHLLAVAAGGALAGKLALVLAASGALVFVLLGGTCAVMMAASSGDDHRPAPGGRSPAGGPPRAAANPSRRNCSLGSWDGAVRGWAKPGQCGQSGFESGYYLRVASNQDEAASRAAVAQAWGRYLDAYSTGAACPSAKEMVFFDRDGESGAGILFPRRPQGWEKIPQSEPQWMLLDSRHQPVTTEVCFFPADESRRAAGWSR